MPIKIISVGERLDNWINEGVKEYQKRMPATLETQIIEIPLAKRGKTGTSERWRTEEAEKILKQVSPGDHIIALDVKGKAFSSEALSERVKSWEESGDKIAIIIGGPDGLDKSILGKADETWSLSKLTLPHPLVRVILCEQLYRAWSIAALHPYHR